jgi:hypothetical protein
MDCDQEQLITGLSLIGDLQKRLLAQRTFGDTYE